MGGGRSHCIAVERACWFAAILAFALQGLAHLFYYFPFQPRRKIKERESQGQFVFVFLRLTGLELRLFRPQPTNQGREGSPVGLGGDEGGP